MSQQQIRQHLRIRAPIERVFAFFADHERFVTLFGARCRRIVDGQDEPNGLGSVRRIGRGPLSFEETIVTFEKNRRIEYAITRGSPIRNHRGTIDFRDDRGATVIDYVIRFEPKIPLTGSLIARGLKLAWRLHAPKVLARLEDGA
ncbi:SRPBCC family protein [Sinimarinibacterium thermocellulolyticum]|uniref:SRPBCC family protein n=1 Tax=Sinimarinibacterium thermocellulolyticum TaxID=3170016 RepID=A0ABV2AD50_9GAMM